MDTAKKSDTGISCGVQSATTENNSDKQSHERLKAIHRVEEAKMRYHVGQVTTLEDLRKVFELRHKIYCVKLGAYPITENQMEMDQSDPFSEHFIATVDEKCIGTLRLIHLVDNVFPMETRGHVLPDWIPRSTTLELSRLIAIYDVEEHKTSLDLTHQAYDWAIKNQITHLVYSGNTMTRAAMKRQRVIADPIGEPILHHNDSHVPLVIPLGERDRFPW